MGKDLQTLNGPNKVAVWPVGSRTVAAAVRTSRYGAGKTESVSRPTTIHTLLKMSRLPLKDPKTFDNFDFSVIKGRDAGRLKSLPSLLAIYAHRNLAFIGPAGTGKTHLARPLAMSVSREA